MLAPDETLMNRPHILMVAANPAISTTTGWPVGFWAAELVHPYHAFREADLDVTIASPDGGRIDPDALSVPNDPSGYSRDDRLSADYLGRPAFVALLQQTPAIAKLRPDDFDAIVVCGGQAPMFTFADAAALQRRFAEFLAAGKPSAALCHGSCLLLYLRDAQGQPTIRGRTITGFTNAEEDVADAAVGQRVMPFRIEDEARRLGADFRAAPAFTSHALRDGNLITGQQQHSGAAVAALVLEALAEGRR